MITKKLDEIFAAYERRKQAEEKAAADRAARERREREGAIAHFRARLLPALHALSQELRKRGHEASVGEALEDEHPTVSIDFTPASRTIGSAVPLISRVVFSYRGGDTVETIQEVARSASRGISEKWRLVDVTEDWAHRQALAMVESSLRNH